MTNWCDSPSSYCTQSVLSDTLQRSSTGCYRCYRRHRSNLYPKQVIQCWEWRQNQQTAHHPPTIRHDTPSPLLAREHPSRLRGATSTPTLSTAYSDTWWPGDSTTTTAATQGLRPRALFSRRGSVGLPYGDVVQECMHGKHLRLYSASIEYMEYIWVYIVYTITNVYDIHVWSCMHDVQETFIVRGFAFMVCFSHWYGGR